MASWRVLGLCGQAHRWQKVVASARCKHHKLPRQAVTTGHHDKPSRQAFTTAPHDKPSRQAIMTSLQDRPARKASTQSHLDSHRVGNVSDNVGR